VSVITLNEERNLPRCLESVRRPAAEIAVLDSGSVDRTAEIAKSFGARFEVLPWRGHAEQYAAAFKLCSQPWILTIDADEALTPELAASIRMLFANGEPKETGFWMNRRTFYFGDWIWHTWQPEWRLRLVRNGHVRMHGINPHVEPKVDGETEKLQGDLLHYPVFRDFHDHLTKSITYARAMADSYAAEGRRAHWYNLVFSPMAAFFKHLILWQGWRDGWRGWLISSAKLVNVLVKYAFLLEKQHASHEPEHRP
jgi:glycosyltransferase involved in cell wall biosynthesis